MSSISARARQARARSASADDDLRLRQQLIRTGATVLRERGLAQAHLSEIAAAADAPQEALTRHFPTKQHLVRAIFEDVIQRMRTGDQTPWYGYGAGIRRSLAAARSFRDGYLLLVRSAAQAPEFEGYLLALRRRSASRLRALLWFPDPPPRPEGRPPLLELVIAPMAAFANEALAHWVEHGDQARDELYIRWYGQTIKAWRHNAAELLNLDSPEVDWPFDTENFAPLRVSGAVPDNSANG